LLSFQIKGPFLSPFTLIPNNAESLLPMSAPVVLPCNTRLGKKINHPCRGGRKVFVGQFPRSTTKEELQRLFEEFGTVEEVFMFKDKCALSIQSDVLSC